MRLFVLLRRNGTYQDCPSPKAQESPRKGTFYPVQVSLQETETEALESKNL